MARTDTDTSAKGAARDPPSTGSDHTGTAPADGGPPGAGDRRPLIDATLSATIVPRQRTARAQPLAHTHPTRASPCTAPRPPPAVEARRSHNHRQPHGTARGPMDHGYSEGGGCTSVTSQKPVGRRLSQRVNLSRQRSGTEPKRGPRTVAVPTPLSRNGEEGERHEERPSSRRTRSRKPQAAGNEGRRTTNTGRKSLDVSRSRSDPGRSHGECGKYRGFASVVSIARPGTEGVGRRVAVSNGRTPSVAAAPSRGSRSWVRHCGVATP